MVSAAGSMQRDALGLSTPFAPAVSPIETRLAEIWAEALGVDAIGADDDYYELGGSSLQGIEIFLRIEEEFGVRLPLSALVERPTIRRIAALIAETGGGDAWSCLVALQPQGSRPPLFCVHDLSGNVVVYRRLAECLGPEQPFYGLQYPGQDRIPLEVLSIEALAARYIAAIRHRQPSGPYHLSGFSIGGLIAFEMACQLVAAGERVALLALLDGWAPGFPAEGWAKLRDHLSELLHRNPLRWPTYLRQRAFYWWDRRGQFRSKQVGAVISGIDPLLWQRILPEAKATYVPQPYPGTIDLFRCSEDTVLWRRAPELGWHGLAAGITIHDVPATHQNLMSDPAVRIVAERLARCLAARATG